MNWQVVSRPEAENEVIEIAAWYNSRSEGLGDRFVEEFLDVLDRLAANPLLHCRRHPRKNIRWQYPKSFPFRVIYEVIEEQQTIVVAAVLHGARRDREWQATSLNDTNEFWIVTLSLRLPSRKPKGAISLNVRAFLPPLPESPVAFELSL